MSAKDNLPQWLCHKKVRAAKIESIVEVENGFTLFLDTGDHLCVDHAYNHKHRPYAGGFYVLYEDGYESFSPATVFKSGYTQLQELPVITTFPPCKNISEGVDIDAVHRKSKAQ